LKIWITPLASVAMLEKLALLKIARWSASALTIDSSVCPAALPEASGRRFSAPVPVGGIVMLCPNSVFGPEQLQSPQGAGNC
jgi:hypothetical protein